jgi:predicted NBD/HSP70 family sugar kinase
MREGSLSSLRERNRKTVIDMLRMHGTLSRAEIARRTGLSRSTVSSLVADLQGSGIVVEQEGGVPMQAQGGRPPVLLALDPVAGTALGVDFGHRHLRVAIADLSSRVLAERHRPHDVDHAADTALQAAAELVDEVLAEARIPRERVLAAGMGVPGPIDRATGVIGSTTILPGWAGLKPGGELERRLGLAVTADNDANLGALAEVAFGAGRGARHAIYVKVSSGIGAGLILGGRLHHGVAGIAGEIGHVQVNADGQVCRCGNRGCLETVASAPALLELLHRSHGDDLTVRGLVALAHAGDPGCRRVLSDAGRAVGRALADLCNCLNPEVLIVGGDLAAAGEPLLEGVREAIRRYALPAAAEAVRVTAGTLGERAEVLGALALVIGDTERLSAAGLSAVQAPLTITNPGGESR